MRLAILFFSFLMSANVSQASPIEIPRTDGSMIRFYFEKPAAKSFPILIVLQGSTCVSVQSVVQMVSQAALSHGAGVIGIEKYGLNETTTSCPTGYLENNTVHQRIQDHLEVVAYLRSHIPEWNQSLGWAGGSEGGQVAALTAPLVRETKMLVMLASGGGLTMAEEMPIVTERKLLREGASAQEIQKAKDDLAAHFQLIRANPTSSQEWLSDGKSARNTYKWWDSVLWIKALPLLELIC
jgi:dienelactone hydrolase